MKIGCERRIWSYVVLRHRSFVLNFNSNPLITNAFLLLYSPQMLTESQILERLKRNEKDAFELLFRTHYEGLVSFAFKYIGNQAEAEEIVQEVFLNLWNKLDSIEVDISLKSYLYQATRNKSLNIIKHRIVQRKYQDHAKFYDDPFDYFNPMELEELQQKIQAAIDKLPPKCKEVFALSRFEEKKYKEIADHLGISVKTVENQMGKALKLLREDLSDYLPVLVFVALELMQTDIGIGVTPFEVV